MEYEYHEARVIMGFAAYLVSSDLLEISAFLSLLSNIESLHYSTSVFSSGNFVDLILYHQNHD